jgi:pyruvate/2-oxoglutarate dehydrogenase complex dihydrolipoamide acyltransferase (E2) component
MATEILVPEVSDGVTEGTVISINVAVGDKVEADQTLLELETDKAVVAIPAPFAGRITEIKVADGDTVAIGAVIMLGESGAAAAAARAPPTEPETPPDAASEPAPEPPP